MVKYFSLFPSPWKKSLPLVMVYFPWHAHRAVKRLFLGVSVRVFLEEMDT